MYKEKIMCRWCSNNKPKPTKKNITSQADSFKKAAYSKVINTVDNEITKSRTRREDLRSFFISNRSKQTALRKLRVKTLFKNRLPLFVFDKPDIMQLI